jgi:hypothetical protein
MKPRHLLVVAVALLTAAVYIENFYDHPTLGNGLRAFAAAVSLGRLA